MTYFQSAVFKYVFLNMYSVIVWKKNLSNKAVCMFVYSEIIFKTPNTLQTIPH